MCLFLWCLMCRSCVEAKEEKGMDEDTQREGS
jgi:hypothetical protein